MSGNFVHLTGTSMASPFVTGIAARCYITGACKSNTGSEMDKVIVSARSYSTAIKSFGFKGDPYHLYAGRFYGFLAYGNAY